MSLPDPINPPASAGRPRRKRTDEIVDAIKRMIVEHGLGPGDRLPQGMPLVGSLFVGLLGYGISLMLYVRAMRDLGAARTGAYFSLAPFAGAILAVTIFGEAVGWQLLVAGGLMAIGVYVHLIERHAHEHRHEVLDHDHAHVHDSHHQHSHGPGDPPGEPHVHAHRHEALVHSHDHYPDIHHRHGHSA